jgi:hypothetical protein
MCLNICLFQCYQRQFLRSYSTETFSPSPVSGSKSRSHSFKSRQWLSIWNTAVKLFAKYIMHTQNQSFFFCIAYESQDTEELFPRTVLAVLLLYPICGEFTAWHVLTVYRSQYSLIYENAVPCLRPASYLGFLGSVLNHNNWDIQWKCLALQ